MNLSKAERIMMCRQFDILLHQYPITPEEETLYKDLQLILEEGYQNEYHRLNPYITSNDDLSTDKCQWVIDILDMYLDTQLPCFGFYGLTHKEHRYLYYVYESRSGGVKLKPCKNDRTIQHAYYMMLPRYNALVSTRTPHSKWTESELECITKGWTPEELNYGKNE